MKKVFLTVVAVLAFTLTNAQEITKNVDSMDEKHYWTAADTPIYSENDKDGFVTKASFKYQAATPIFTGINITVIGWSCLENVALIILFDDGTKLKKTSWNKFNCDGNAWYSWTKKDIEKLSTTPISKIKITNGRDYDSFTFESPNPNYFVDVVKTAKTGVFETVEM